VVLAALNNMPGNTQYEP